VTDNHVLHGLASHVGKTQDAPNRQQRRKPVRAPVKQTARKQNQNRMAQDPNRVTRNGVNNQITTTNVPVGNAIAMQAVSRPITRPDRINFGDAKYKKLSHDGLAFLKCAFAPPDFAAGDVAGVPDSFQGESLTVKSRYTTPSPFNSGTDTYLLVTPSPGIAYFVLQKTIGAPVLATDAWTAAPYSEFANFFPNVNEADKNFERFRFVSNHLEIVPTVNQMGWAGSISAWKLNVLMVNATPLTIGGVANTDTMWRVQGLEAVNGTNQNQYVSGFTNGFYGGCYNANCTFEFQNIQEKMSRLPISLDTLNDPSMFGQLNGPLVGMDNNFESLVVKVTTPTGYQNSAVIRTWACVEYMPKAGSPYKLFTRYSPSDQLAVEYYRKIIQQLPVGVSFADNPDFWRRVLSIIRQLSGGLSVIPGPYGMIAQGVNAVTGGIQELF
jgi:hypothetical protein